MEDQESWDMEDETNDSENLDLIDAIIQASEEDPLPADLEEEDQELTDRLALAHADHTHRLLVADIIRVARRPLRPADVLEMLSGHGPSPGARAVSADRSDAGIVAALLQIVMRLENLGHGLQRIGDGLQTVSDRLGDLTDVTERRP